MPRKAAEYDKDQFKKDVLAGMTGKALAEKYKVSVPTISNRKNDLGLTKKRGSKKTARKLSKGPARPNKTVRSKVSGSWKEIDNLIDMLKSNDSLSMNVKSAIKADLQDLISQV